MLCWSINVVKWKIRQGRGVRNGNTLAKKSVYSSVFICFRVAADAFPPPLRSTFEHRQRKTSIQNAGIAASHPAHKVPILPTSALVRQLHRKLPLTGLEISSLAASPSWFAAHVGIIAMTWCGTQPKGRSSNLPECDTNRLDRGRRRKFGLSERNLVFSPRLHIN